MNNASGTEGHGRGKHEEGEPLFPSEGQFSRVVPLSQKGRDAARRGAPPASGESEELDETTLVHARASTGQHAAHTSRAKLGAEQSWAFLAAVVVLSLVAGAATGVYILRWQNPPETYHPGTSAAGGVPAGEAAGKVNGTEPAAEPPAPQTSGPAPQTERDGLVTRHEPAASPVVPAAPAEAATKAERANTSADRQKASPQAAEPPARRAAEPEPRGGRPARAAAEVGEASPAPRLTRPEAGQRRPGGHTPATGTPPERPPLVSSPPPSSKPRKVIQWP